MSLLKNKIFILVVVVLLVLAGVVGYKFFSIYAFNSLSKELEPGNKELFDGFKDEVAGSNRINLNILKASQSLSDPTSFSKDNVDKYLDQAKTEYNNSADTYKKGLDKLDSSVSKLDNLSKIPLWLGSDQKKFVSDVTDSLDAYKAARKADYDFMVKTKPVFDNSLQVIGDTAVLYGHTLTLASAKTEEEAMAALTQNFSQLAPLEKYSKDSYKFEGQDTLAAEYPDSYKAFAAFKTVFGQYYLAIKGLSEGDMSQAAKLTEIGASFVDSISALQNPFMELSAKAKPNTTKIKDAYASYTKALDFYSEKKLYSKENKLVQNNQNKAVVFAYAIQLYEIDKNKPPASESFSDLLSTLRGSNYLSSDLKYNENDFSYTSDGAMYFEIGYKDEVSNKMEIFVIGVKEAVTTSLGASTQVVKIKDVEINLNFANTLVNYISSLTY
ncbi:MAG: hypothetical protein A2113_00760 [Candidatus Woykebacteria bacterium GWA1_44_8]|uniref:Uncharacterized protein n=1 Tax=Candidatus Woykebacteria bacterium GWA1_44_8 TaxID=1802591 RepID=A0A1G1W2N1_9BACT|nr:MAG: hypothetical protein A2113_00760 [Candidatus Woykebacteria bacterium GWA1_44_8]